MSALPPFWVVSLEDACERREFVSEGFAELGLPFEILDAVDGRHLSAEQRGTYSHVRALFEVGRGLTEGELGCMLSHLAAYRRLVDEQRPEAVILEDDACPTPDLIALLEARATFPPGWDVVNFKPLFGDATARPIGAPLLGGRYRVVTYPGNPYGSSCYLIRLDAARRLLRVGRPVRMPADDLLFRPKPAGLRTYGIEPSPVVHGRFPSERVGRADAIAPSPPSARIWEQPVVLAGKSVHKARRAWARIALGGS